MGVEYEQIQIGYQKTSSRSYLAVIGRRSLSFRLLVAPSDVIDNAFVKELSLQSIPTTIPDFGVWSGSTYGIMSRIMNGIKRIAPHQILSLNVILSDGHN